MTCRILYGVLAWSELTPEVNNRVPWSPQGINKTINELKESKIKNLGYETLILTYIYKKLNTQILPWPWHRELRYSASTVWWFEMYIFHPSPQKILKSQMCYDKRKALIILTVSQNANSNFCVENAKTPLRLTQCFFVLILFCTQIWEQVLVKDLYV